MSTNPFLVALSLLLWISLASAATPNGTEDRFLPPESANLRLAAPIDSWDEAVPLGNGLLGGLFWGRDNTIRLSLDRGDLWDLRVQEDFKRPDCTWKTIQKLVAEKNQAEVVRRFDAPYGAPWPTKLPGGRLELTLDASQRVSSFWLDLATAVGRAELSAGKRLEAFASATQPVILLRAPASTLKQWRIVAPAAVKILGYPPATAGEDGDTKWFVQESATGSRHAVVASLRRNGDDALLAVTITTSRDDADPVGLGRRRVAAAIQAGYDGLLGPHQTWWRDFWHKSRVELPDLNHLRHYYLVQYFYGSASRLGAPPMPLQGVWTADDGGLPPWKGDYHNDLNTQMTYIAYQTAGRFEEGRCFLEFLWKLLPEFRHHARTFYEAPGAAMPGVMALDGKPLGGWTMYTFHPTGAAWIGQLFHQHWRYTMDDAFLRERAYPWCTEIGECLLHLLKPDTDGHLKLPLSASPEIHDNSLRAWLKPNSNYDHDCMVALFAGLVEMGDALGKNNEAAKWKTALAGLGPRAVDAQTRCLMLAPGENLLRSHRHLSNIISIYPFGLLNIEGTQDDRAIIAASCKQYDALGTRAWCGYSFTWMSALRARAGDAEAAIQNLDTYEKAYILPNGFHANGNRLKADYSKATDCAFTLEGNFLASQAVHEMLLQSWGGVIRVFPATPSRWREAAFEDLRAEGGYRVSARRENGLTVKLEVLASRDGVVKIRDSFAGRKPIWNRAGVEKIGENWQFPLKAGQSMEAHF